MHSWFDKSTTCTCNQSDSVCVESGTVLSSTTFAVGLTNQQVDVATDACNRYSEENRGREHFLVVFRTGFLFSDYFRL